MDVEAAITTIVEGGPRPDEVEVLLNAFIEQRHDLRRWQVRADHAERNLTELARGLDPLCPCETIPDHVGFGPQRECPLHGDGVTFVAHVQRIERERHNAINALEHVAATIEQLTSRRVDVSMGGDVPPARLADAWAQDEAQDDALEGGAAS